jgi:small subunit ribosomal protein S2
VAILIVYVNPYHTAVKQAKRLGITTLALVDSNCDPDHIDFVIAGNDDAIRAASTVAGALAEAAREGREMAGKKAPPAKGEKSAGRDEAPMREKPAVPATPAAEPAVQDEPPAPAVEREVPLQNGTVPEAAPPPESGQPAEAGQPAPLEEAAAVSPNADASDAGKEAAPDA